MVDKYNIGPVLVTYTILVISYYNIPQNPILIFKASIVGNPEAGKNRSSAIGVEG